MLNKKIGLVFSIISGLICSVMYWRFLSDGWFNQDDELMNWYLKIGFFIGSHGFLFGSVIWYYRYFQKQKNFYCTNSFTGSKTRCLNQCESCKQITKKYGV